MFFSLSTTTFDPSVRRGTTGVVVGNGPHEPGPAIMVGAWFLAGNEFGLRQISFGKCCTGRGGAHVSFSVSTTTVNTFAWRGMMGAVLCVEVISNNKMQFKLKQHTKNY